MGLWSLLRQVQMNRDFNEPWSSSYSHPTLPSQPYTCPECNEGFSHSSNLIVHRRIHTGEKPYRCRLCGEGVISTNDLKRHMKKHAGQLPFACGTCKATFSQRRQLVSHTNKVHGGQVVEEAVALTMEDNGDYQYRYHSYKLYNDQLWVVIIQFMTTSQNQSYNDVSLGVDPVARASIITS